LILSGAFYPDLKIGVWRRRTYQIGEKGTLDKKVGGSKKAFGEQFKYDTINHYFHPGLS